jgi:hypothetical protein
MPCTKWSITDQSAVLDSVIGTYMSPLHTPVLQPVRCIYVWGCSLNSTTAYRPTMRVLEKERCMSRDGFVSHFSQDSYDC